MKPLDNLKPWPLLIAERRGGYNPIPIRSDDPLIGIPGAQKSVLLPIFSDRNRRKMDRKAIRFLENGKEWYTSKL